MNKLKVLELFGGIGACSKALERLGIDYEIADYVEIDKYAVKSFNAMHGTNFDSQDICEWDKDIKVDLIMHGSPCQDFSLAGKQAGGDEGSGTRSSLMYETIRIVEKLKPKYVIWENVKNIISKKHKHNYDNYCNKMSELGYISYGKVLNAKDYGIPQNRERVFTISILKEKIVYDDYNSNIRKDQSTIGTLTTNCGSGAPRNGWKIIETSTNFEFPPKQELKLKLKDMLEDNVDEKYYLSDTQINRIKTTTYNVGKTRIQEKEYCDTLCARDWKDPKCIQVGELNIKGHDIIKRIYSSNGISSTLTDMQGGNRQPKINSGLNVRKLTPKECWRLMGFDDEDFEKAEKVNSNTQLYKQAGNSIVVNVLEEILKELLC